MTEQQALTLIAELACATTGNWDDPTVEYWTERLCELGDPTTAKAAVTALCDTWTSPGAPPWGSFLSIYREHAKRNATTPRVLPSGDRPISFTDYISRLERRKGEGSIEAAELLDIFRRHPDMVRAITRRAA